MEMEGGEDELGSHAELLSGHPPAQPSRDHQVHHEEEIVAEIEDDALADAAHCAHLAADEGVDRRIVGAQDKRTRDEESLQALADRVPREGLQVDANVGQLRHPGILR